MKCKLCGFEYGKSAPVCKSCPIAGKCGKVICCPHCGYQTIEESSLTVMLSKLLRKGGNKNGTKNGD